MFDKIQHIGYLTADLEEALAWFDKSFGGKSAGGGQISPSYAVTSGGRNAYVRFGQVEAEIIEPQDKTGLAANGLTMHHVGYVVADIRAAKRDPREKAQAMDPAVTRAPGEAAFLA